MGIGAHRLAHYADPPAWYDAHGDEFASRTQDLDVSQLVNRFTALVKPGGRVLDLGCGSGRDTLAMIRLGFDVTPVDASERMCRIATRRTGRAARVERAQDMGYFRYFDGIWAMASLLHVPKQQLPLVLWRVHRALREGGAFFCCLKHGEGERYDEEGRFFHDITEERLRGLLAYLGLFDIVEIWRTGPGGTPDPNGCWMNLLATAGPRGGIARSVSRAS